jgi:hypothetical protein
MKSGCVKVNAYVDVRASSVKNPLASVRALGTPAPEITTLEIPVDGLPMPTTCPVAFGSTADDAVASGWDVMLGDVGATRPQLAATIEAPASAMMMIDLGCDVNVTVVRRQSIVHRENSKSSIV